MRNEERFFLKSSNYDRAEYISKAENTIRLRQLMTKKILIVDDSEMILKLMELALKIDGHDIIKASNGKEALDILMQSESLPNLIIADLMMPIMDGWTFIEELAKDVNLKNIPVIVVSAYCEELEIPKRAKEALIKPVDFKLLKSVVHKYI